MMLVWSTGVQRSNVNGSSPAGGSIAPVSPPSAPLIVEDVHSTIARADGTPEYAFPTRNLGVRHDIETDVASRFIRHDPVVHEAPVPIGLVVKKTSPFGTFWSVNLPFASVVVEMGSPNTPTVTPATLMPSVCSQLYTVPVTVEVGAPSPPPQAATARAPSTIQTFLRAFA